MSADEHTFLFADLVGFTALTDSEGDERAAAVGAALQARVRAMAAEHDAEVVRGMGDAAMVRCEDPARAIRFALHLLNEVDSDPVLPPVRVESTADRRWAMTETGTAARSTSRRGSARSRRGERSWSAKAPWRPPASCPR